MKKGYSRNSIYDNIIVHCNVCNCKGMYSYLNTVVVHAFLEKPIFLNHSEITISFHVYNSKNYNHLAH